MTHSDGVVIDPKAQARLLEWGGAKLVTQMIKLFLENAPTRIDQVRRGVNGGGTMKEAERGAHSLKSSAANVGAVTLSRISAEIEDLASREDVAAIQAAVPRLEAAYTLVSAELAATLARTGSDE